MSAVETRLWPLKEITMLVLEVDCGVRDSPETNPGVREELGAKHSETLTDGKNLGHQDE
jgi:hypothetical protein